MPLYGHELGTDTFPVQAGLGRVVALKTKEGDFVGRAAVEAGPPDDARVLVGLTADGKRAGRAGYDVLQRRPASSARSPPAPSRPPSAIPIAMAYVDAVADRAGTELDLDVRGTRVPATVVSLPFYKLRKEKRSAHD